MDAFERAREGITSDRWLDVRYEDFLEDPKGTVETIVAFMARPMSDVLRRSVGVQRFDASRRNAYRRSLSEGDVSALNTVLAEHLERYGYLSAGEAGTPEIAM